MDENEVFLPTQHARMALRAFAGSPDFIDQILAGSGLTRQQIDSPHFVFPASALWPILDNVARMLGPGWFLNFPALWGFEVQSEFGLAIRSAPDLRHAIDVIVEFGRVRWPIGAAEGRSQTDAYVLEKGDVYIMDITGSEVVGPLHWQFVSSLVALNFQTVVGSINPDIAARMTIRFKGEAPPYADELQTRLAPRTSWGNSRFEIEIPADLLAVPSNFRDDHTHHTAVSMLRDEAATRIKSVTIKSRALSILSDVKVGRMHVDDLASAMGMSMRTLERRLLAAGTSVRQLQDEALKLRFRKCVVEPGPTSAFQIAFQLGYNDAASLTRACKRWFGLTFQEARRMFQEQVSIGATPDS